MDSSTISSDSSINTPSDVSEGPEAQFWFTPGGITLIVFLVIIALFLIIFLPILFEVILKTTSFPVTYTSPAIAGGTLSQNITYSIDTPNQMATVNFPAFSFNVDPHNNSYGLVAPGNSNFPRSLVPDIGLNPVPSANTVITFSGGAQTTAAATITLNVDGSVYLTPNAPVFFGTANGTSVSVAACSVTYQTAVAPPVLTYGTITGYQFSGAFLAANASTTLYYSTNAANTFVNLVIPSLSITTGSINGNTVNSVTALHSASPKLIPAAVTVGNLLEPAYNNGVNNTNRFNIDLSGNIALTNNQAAFTANQVGASYGFLVIQYNV